MRPVTFMCAILKVVGSALAIFALAASNWASANDFSAYVNADGKISLPQGFRSSFVHLGSWFAPEGDASGFHDVYMDASSVTYYQEHGRFRDGAIMVKEVRAHTEGAYTTGDKVAYANATVKLWFVMVKDREGRFAENTNWGNGWGWALFKPGQSGNRSTHFRTDCLGCHVPAQKTDWVYVEAYPTLTTQ